MRDWTVCFLILVVIGLCAYNVNSRLDRIETDLTIAQSQLGNMLCIQIAEETS